jgi:hypothetical protein
VSDIAKMRISFRKSTHSVTGECIEAGSQSSRLMAVRDSKDAGGPQISISSADWRGFVSRIKAGRLPLS